MLSPAVFVPVLEDHHLIWELDRHVLRQACAFRGARKRRGLTYVPRSVNLSRSDFSVSNLYETISQIIAENGLAPAELVAKLDAEGFAPIMPGQNAFFTATARTRSWAQGPRQGAPSGAPAPMGPPSPNELGASRGPSAP